MLPHYRQVASTDAIARVAREAERLGYDSVWVSDQIIVLDEDAERFGEVFYDSMSVLAYVSACTSKVMLGTSVIVLPYRNPVHLAKVTATVDSLSRGRLLLGVGVGGVNAEFRALSAPWEDRGKHTDESLRVLRELWTNNAPHFQGSYYNFAEIQFYPKPVQRPYPPLWIGGDTPRALRRVAEFGDVWHPGRSSPEMLAEWLPRMRKLAQDAGRDPLEIGIAPRQPMKIVTDGSQALDEWPLFGTVEKLIDSVGRFQEVGAGHLVMDTFYGMPELLDETVDGMIATMEHFASAVMPHFPGPTVRGPTDTR